MTTYKTPGIYPNRQGSLLAQSNSTETAVPAFIGLTRELRGVGSEDLTNKVIKISSLNEYESIFGKGQDEKFQVQFSPSTETFELIDVGLTSLAVSPSMFFYSSIALYFSNGGGDCYVISVGAHSNSNTCLTAASFMKAIDLLEEQEAVTLLSIPESVLLESVDHYKVQQYALQHCEKMQNRFFLLDVKQTSGIVSGDLEQDISDMREHINQALSYGAAYYPYVRTSQPRSYDESEVNVAYQLTTRVLHDKYLGKLVTINNQSADPYGYLIDTVSDVKSTGPYIVYIRVSASILVDDMGFKVDEKGIRILGVPPYGIFTDNTRSDFLDHQGFIVNGLASNDSSHLKKNIATQTLSLKASLGYLADAKWSLASPAIYSEVSRLLANNYRELPPSTLVAGVIVKTDAASGVWRVPANVVLNDVIGPCVAIDNGQQQALNVDVMTGKSVNAIRQFIGKGSLLWGGRTLNGNHDEWRYISVRRVFNMVEAYLKKATQFAIFEPNTPFTWLKIKTIIENYLESVWQQGALFGETSEHAFYVNVGLGKTMTQQDINNGLIHIDVGLAVVRPAEFVILTFTRETD